MRVLLILLPIVSGAGGMFAFGYWFGRRRPTLTEKELRLREHARLMRESRDAHMRGDLAWADSLERAAERVLDGKRLDDYGR
jgi:hypothetical protein